jgi:molecular chaperone DnaK
VATPDHSPLMVSGRVALPPTPAKRPLLLDVTPASLSIQSVGGYSERLLDKNAPIPIEKTRRFTTARDNQTRVEIDCCRGESRRYAENEPLGTPVLEDLPPRPRGEVQIEVSFRIDVDGILHVSATDQASGVRREAHLQVLGAPVGGP